MTFERNDGRGRGGGEGKSWRGVVEAAAEAKLNNLGQFQAPYIPQEVGRVTIWLTIWLQGCGEQSQELMGELKSLLGTGRCCHIACYCW